jgi:hypothetical protein
VEALWSRFEEVMGKEGGKEAEVGGLQEEEDGEERESTLEEAPVARSEQRGR